jgi:hypothetical protein
MDDERPPICPVCGVTMVPAELSARKVRGAEWICLECEETAEPDSTKDLGGSVALALSNTMTPGGCRFTVEHH